MMRTVWASCATVVRQHRPRRRLVPLPGWGKNQTPITPISQKHADSPSTGMVATLARPNLPIEGFCEIGEICGHLRQVFSGHPGRRPLDRDDSDSSTAALRGLRSE